MTIASISHVEERTNAAPVCRTVCVDIVLHHIGVRMGWATGVMSPPLFSDKIIDEMFPLLSNINFYAANDLS